MKMNLSFEDIKQDENYIKGFNAGRKLAGYLIAIEANCYLLTASQYKKFSAMDKEPENISYALEYVQTFGEKIGYCEQYNY